MHNVLPLFSLLCHNDVFSPVSIRALRALRLDGNRAKRKRLRWQAANHGCHCFDRTSYWLLLAAWYVFRVKAVWSIPKRFSSDAVRLMRYRLRYKCSAFYLSLRRLLWRPLHPCSVSWCAPFIQILLQTIHLPSDVSIVGQFPSFHLL